MAVALGPWTTADVGSDPKPADVLVAQCIRAGLPFLIAVIAITAASDVILGRPHVFALVSIKALQIGVLALEMQAFRKPYWIARAVPVALVVGVVFYLGTAAGAILDDDTVTAPLFLSAFALGVAAAVPWGWRPQLVTIVTMVAPLLWNTYMVAGGLQAVFPYPGFIVIAALVGSIYIAYDSERSRTAIALRDRELTQSEARYRQIVEQATDLIYRTDATGHVVFFNPPALRLMRYAESELQGRHFLDFVSPEARDEVARFYGRQFVNRVPNTYREVPVVTGDGTQIWIGQNVQLLIEDGQVAGFQSVARDITDRVQIEEALRLSEKRFRDAFDHAPIGVALVAPDGRFLRANGALCNMLGYSAEELTTINFQSLTHVEDLRHNLALMRECLGNKRTSYEMEKRYLHKDGHIVQVQLKASLVRDRQGSPVHFVTQIDDVTERRLVEQALRESEERFRTISASAHDGIVMMDPEGRVAFWNHAAETIFGYTAAEALGAPLHELVTPAASRERQHAGLVEFRASGTGAVIGRTLELTARRKGGAEFPVELSVAAMHLGNRRHAVGIVRDITARKQIEAELQHAKAAAEAATRAKSEFLANMSHEIRTPLCGVIGMTELVLATDLTPEQREYLDLSRTSADALLTVINDILDFSKIEAGKLDLEEAAFSARETLAAAQAVVALRARDQGLKLRTQLTPEVPDTLLGDQGRLRQVLINLLGNAVKFTEQGSVTVSVSVGADESVDASGVQLHFAVCDTGPGIPSAEIERIFRAFEQAEGSTRRRYGGTGLGLSICQRLVTMMGGRFWVESELGYGSTFHFTARFGRVMATTGSDRAGDDRPNQPEEREGHVEAQPSTSLRVLVAEDNAVNRKLIARLLEKRGHRVVTATDGKQALATLDRERIDLVLMDVQMPEMDGIEATAEIRQRERDGRRFAARGQRIPIIALTASAMKSDEERCLAAGMDAYVAKPIDAERLFRVMHAMVAAAVVDAAA